MSSHTHSPHTHNFNPIKLWAEKRTLIVFVITLFMMVAEIVTGWITNSVALFADGWHMGTHALALWIALCAYVLARKFARHTGFALGTWKIEILGAYTSALLLGTMGVYVMIFSFERLLSPTDIEYDAALFVAILWLLVNAICALILWHQDDHHWHDHSHGSHSHSHDLNLRSAYIHVIADALTSVLAIVALIGAKYFNLNFLDPLMWLLGALLIFRWTYSLLRDTSSILLDKTTDAALAAEVRHQIESDGMSTVNDLHLWQVGPKRFACIISIDAKRNYTTHDYQHRLMTLPSIIHSTVEVENHK